MCVSVIRSRTANASKLSTSSPGSMSTPCRVRGQATTNPFLKNGPTACDSTMITTVILAILDDLLFTSKIRGTAKQIGAPLSVAKSRDAALTEMRANLPALVVLDLDNPRTDPLGIIADMKGDPALAGIATVGFVSHVHTGLIEAARKAGVSEVMARSLFAERLPQILAKGM